MLRSQQTTNQLWEEKKNSEKNIISVDITCMPGNCKACHVLSVNRIIFLKLKEAQIGLSLCVPQHQSNVNEIYWQT